MKKKGLLFITGLLVVMSYYLYNMMIVNKRECQYSVVEIDTSKRSVKTDSLKPIIKPRRVDFKFLKMNPDTSEVKIDTFFYLIDYVPGDTFRQIVYHEGLERDSLLEKVGFDYLKDACSSTKLLIWLEVKRDSVNEYAYLYTGYLKNFIGLSFVLRFQNRKWVGVNNLPGVWSEVPPPKEEYGFFPWRM